MRPQVDVRRLVSGLEQVLYGSRRGAAVPEPSTGTGYSSGTAAVDRLISETNGVGMPLAAQAAAMPSLPPAQTWPGPAQAPAQLPGGVPGGMPGLMPAPAAAMMPAPAPAAAMMPPMAPMPPAAPPRQQPMPAVAQMQPPPMPAVAQMQPAPMSAPPCRACPACLFRTVCLV